jgi:hypothetical protein
MGTGPGLARQEAVGLDFGQLGYQIEMSFRSKLELLAHYLDLLLTLANNVSSKFWLQ